MYKLLIPLFFCLLGTTTILHAQVPKNISVPTRITPAYQPSGDSPEMMCNNAGTFQLGAFTGQSNDTDLTGPQDTIFLCRNDQIEIDHNGDFDLSGDPQPATPPGIGWAFYTCAPTVMGDNLTTILTDPCILPGATNGIWVATEQPNGDIPFINNGGLQTAFNSGQPILLHFAPITLDVFATQGFEGTPAGPCVNVNTAVEFKVVYLNAIEESGVSTNFGNDCLGKFRIEGGYPEWNTQAVYTITITLASDPTVKAVIQTAATQLFHGADVIFSVPQSGVYDVVVEDGKSCGHTFQINMNVCNAMDNVVFALPDTVSPPGSTICVPITVQNFDLVGASFSLNWDPTILQYNDVQNPHPTIGIFNASNLNTQSVNQGRLGTIIYDQVNLGNVISVPDGEALFEVCFTVIGPLGACSPLGITNSPSAINIEDELGAAVALTAIDGQVCVDFVPLSYSISIVDTTCTGTASIEVTVTGGTLPYEIIRQRLPGGAVNLANISTAGGTATFAGQMNGDYEIRISDNNGFGTTIRDTVNIDIQTLGVALDVTSQLPTCNGSTDGVVTASVLIGTTPVNNPAPPQFTFNWLPTTVPTPAAAVQTGVGAGTYFVTVTDAMSGCTAVASGSLGQPSIINDQNITIAPASCTGICDGSISYTAIGGTPYTTSGSNTYDYNWEYSPDVASPPSPVLNGTGNSNPFLLTNLCAGSYFVTITDANGCTLSDEVIVTDLRVVELTIFDQQNTSCAKLDDGTATVEVVETPSTGATFNFFWAPNGFNQTNTATTSTYDGLAAGSYNVLATDAAGCADTLTVIISSPTEIMIDTINLIQPSCTLQNDGAISTFTSGGTGGPFYSYTWSANANSANTPFVNNLIPGTYTITVTDVNGCQDSLSFDLALPAPPTIDGIDSVSVRCGSDGCLTVLTTTGTNFTWQASDGTILPSNTEQICDLPGGTYIVTIIDDQGCGIQDTLTLGSVDTLSFSDTTFLIPSCFGYDDGRISVGVTGGNPNYTFLWSPSGQITGTLIDVEAGPYSVVVTDAQGCTLTGNFTLLEPPAIVNTFAQIQGVSCFGTCDGEAAPVVQFATTPPSSGNFSFVWQGGITDSLRTNLCAGINRVTITDGGNCFLVDSVFIDGPTAVAFTALDSTSTSCNGSDDGSVTVSGSGGNGGPFTYLWDTPNADAVATVSNLEAGIYFVTITDKDGCTGVYSTEVTEPDPILLQEGPGRDIQCFGGTDGELSVVVTGGNIGTFLYSWSDGTNVISTTASATNLGSGTYAVTATDASGCTGELSNLVLTDPPPVQGAYLPWEPLVCNGDETTLVIDTIFGGAGAPYQFSVDFGVQLSQDFPITLSGGEHFITYFDVRNCEYTDTITIDEPLPIVVSFDPNEIEIELGDSLVLQPIVTGAVIDSFIWTPANLLFNPTVLNPTAYTFESETFNLVVFDENGCSGTGSILINVDPNRNVYLPNIFTPNNPSGQNDHFNVYVGAGVKQVNFMRIFNRWGELMYERNSFFPDNDNLSEGWDGRYKGDLVSPGVYVYIVEVEFLDDRVLLYRGDVTTIR